MIVSSIIRERKYIKTCAFCHWAQDILGYSKKTNRMYKMKRNRMSGNIYRMKKVTSEMEFHYS
jgi:hypothetical protein